MENFRCFRRAGASFVHRGSSAAIPGGALKNVTLLVGINGTGKTSILRAIALGVLSPILGQSGYRPYYLVRVPKAGARAMRAGVVSVDGVLDKHEINTFGVGLPQQPNYFTNTLEIVRRNDYDLLGVIKLEAKSGDVTAGLGGLVYFEHAPSFRIENQRVDKRSDRFAFEYYKDFSPSFLVLGYAATRRVEEPSRSAIGTADKARGRRYLRVAGLFEEGVTLIPLASWLPQLRRTDRHKEITRLLNRTLPSGMRFTGRFHKDQQPLFAHQGVVLPFPALSDGYRAYIGLLGDILSHLSDCCPKGRPLTDLTGVVMVDDVDLHLHPQWQRVVVPRLARAFPNLQFILTTHSPLVVGTVHAENVRVIGNHQIHQFSERLHGLSVDQILSGPYFNYTKPRTDESEKELQALLEGPIDKGDAEPALEFLRELSGQKSTKK
jgi:hypothetical protein